MTLIAAGQGLNRRAIAGFRANANLEAQRVQAGEAISAQKNAQAMNTMGTGAGIGAMYGMKNLAAATPAPSGGMPPLSSGGVPAPSLASGNTAALVTEGKLAAMANTAPITTGTTGTAIQNSTVAALDAAQAAAAAEAGAVTTGGAVTSGGAASGGAAAGGAGAGAGGALANIAAIAGPLAIGLGAAYLITKLFD